MCRLSISLILLLLRTVPAAATPARDFDDPTEAWVRRMLPTAYQEDGLPVLRDRSFASSAPNFGASATVLLHLSQDTQGWYGSDDARRYASEAAIAASPARLGRPLDRAELRGIIRAPLAEGIWTRLRLHVPVVGVFDASVDLSRADGSQIPTYTEPTRFSDVSARELAISWHRSFDLMPVVEALLDLGYRRIDRTGWIEFTPDASDGQNGFELRPALARPFGPHRITLGANYVWVALPAVPGARLEDRSRRRSLWAAYVDYSRFLDPGGLHLYAGYLSDDETLGVRFGHRRDLYAGTSLRGLGRFDLTVQVALLLSGLGEARREANGAVVQVLVPEHAVRQVRPSVLLLYRIIDPAPQQLSVLFPLRADIATGRGSDAFDNVRGGAALWATLATSRLPGSHLVLTAGYEAQWFHRLGKVAHVGTLQLRLGWASG